jgi:secreted trypsin-like serine protease
MRKLLLLTLAAAAVGAALTVGTARAVQGGTLDTANTYSYVAMSVYYDAAGVPLWRCSGTMISPRRYVTAGHCTGLDEGAVPAHAELWFTNKFTAADIGDYPFDGSSCAGYTGYPCKGDVGGTPNPNPGWTGELTLPDTHDMGVVALDRDAPVTTFAQLAPVGYLDKLATARGKQNVNFTVVGYGVQFERPNLEIALGQRFIGTTQLQDLRSNQVGDAGVRMTDAAGGGTGGGGTCYGDSGGPVFHTAANGVQYLVADISAGTKWCKGTSYAYRLDTAAAQAFIGQYPR